MPKPPIAPQPAPAASSGSADEVPLVIKGTAYRFVIPAVSVRVARRAQWLQRRSAIVEQELDGISDDDEAERLISELNMLQERAIRTLIPAWPDGLFEDLGPGDLRALSEAFQRVMGAAVEQITGTATSA